MPNKDDEKLIWLIIGFLFTGALIGMDIYYSSFSQMSGALMWIVSILHLFLVAAWVIAMVKFNDPNYEATRKIVVGLCVILGLIVGIHHATSREDKQVIIDSKEAAAKDTLR